MHCFRQFALVGGIWAAASASATAGQVNAYVQTNLVADTNTAAKVTDGDLQNAWGLAFFPGSQFWVADNATGVVTLYDGTGAKNALVVRIPPPSGSMPGTVAAPTGVLWNPTSQFKIPGTQFAAVFIFDTEDGTLAAWNPGLPDPTQALLAVDNSKAGRGAVYKALTFGSNATGNFLFATNFRAGTIDVFDANFQPATLDGGFVDPQLPPGFAPFGIRNIDGDLVVTYALQDAAKHDDVAGAGHGFVDIFDTDGHLLRRFASQGTLDSPWGIARAPFDFGAFSGDVLIGNFGDGAINAFAQDGGFDDQLRDQKGNPIMIDGLWSLVFGGATKSDPDVLYFTAGPNDEKDGLFGTIIPAGAATLQASTK